MSLRSGDPHPATFVHKTQDDNLYPHLTVRETLLLQAQFFMSAELPKQQREAFVDDVILELGLIKAQNTTIGSAKVRGVSGGERKRVSIATQLITDPSILFLDEPTSGLDGFQAQSVMEAMKNLTSNNRFTTPPSSPPNSSLAVL
jgi:ABC-type multidrug transport system ATPase subunit